MRHIGKLAGAALIILAPTAAFAQAGAPAGAPLQPGNWGQGGWQAGTAGAGYAPAPRTYAQQTGGWQQGPEVRAHGDYRPLERGKRVPHAYLDAGYTVSDWNDWGFAPPGPGLRWVRYYDDGLLIDGDGRIVDARYGVDWNHGRVGGPRIAYAGGAGIYPGYAGGASYAYPAAAAPAYGYAGGAAVIGAAPGVTTYRVGPNTTVTTAVVQAPSVVVGAPYGYAGGATVVNGAAAAPVYGYAGGATVVGAPVAPVYGYAGGAAVVGTAGVLAVTTTTTTTDYQTVYKAAPVRRARVRPIRRYRPRCVTATCPVLGS
jgi:Ni/Co efflux regulator RcnB